MKQNFYGFVSVKVDKQLNKIKWNKMISHQETYLQYKDTKVSI